MKLLPIMGQLILIMVLCLVSLDSGPLFQFDHGLVAHLGLKHMRLYPCDFWTAKLKEFEKIFPVWHPMAMKYVNIVIPILSLMSYYENCWCSMAMLDYWRLNHVDDVKAHTCTSNARSPQEMERGQEDQFFRHEFCSHNPSKSSVYLTIEKWRSPMENASHSISQFNTIHSCSHIQIQQTNPSRMTVPSTPPKPNMEPEKSPLWKNMFIFQIVILGFHLSFGATLFPTCFFCKTFRIGLRIFVATWHVFQFRVPIFGCSRNDCMFSTKFCIPNWRPKFLDSCEGDVF